MKNNLTAKILNRANTLVFTLALISTLPACTKTGLPGLPTSSTGGGSGATAALLSQEVDVTTNAQNVVIDSVNTQYQYDNNNNVAQVQRAESYTISGISESSLETWQFTYNNNLITGSIETISSQSSLGSSNSNGQVITTFYSSGAHLSYSVSNTTWTINSYGQTVNSSSSDSALFTYSGNHISHYTSYHAAQGQAYSLFVDNSYNYNGANLTGFTELVTSSGNSSAVTASYSYDSKTSYLPINYITPGVYFYTPNNVTKLSIVSTGSSASQITTDYQWTYNSSNQPSACKATITTNPSGPDNGAVISSTYTYQ